MGLEYRMNENYDALTANDREVLNQILRHKDRAKAMNSTELAAFCHISRTTLVRLYKKLGIATFAQFCLELKEQPGRQEIARLDMRDIICDYHRMVDDLKAYDYGDICQVIYQADTVYLYGTGNEQKAIGEEFKRIFLMFGKCCIDLFDYGEVEYASRNFKEKDLFVAISLSGESEHGIRVLRFVQSRSIGTLSITRWTNNTMARMCRYNLYAGTKLIGRTESGAGHDRGKETPGSKEGPEGKETLGSKEGPERPEDRISGAVGQGSAGYEMVAAFYILLDILSVNYLEYVRENHEAGRTV